MNETAGKVFSLASQYAPEKGCTISGELFASDQGRADIFSLAPHTDISAESWPSSKLVLVLDGKLEIVQPQKELKSVLENGQAMIIAAHSLTGYNTESGAVYLELTLNEGKFNSALPVDQPFSLADQVPLRKGRIVNMDAVSNPGMKFVLMSFDENTGLSEHAAPGDALIFALKGSGLIGYEGREHSLKAGENFKFAAGGKHKVSADGPFTMALLMELPSHSTASQNR